MQVSLGNEKSFGKQARLVFYVSSLKDKSKTVIKLFNDKKTNKGFNQIYKECRIILILMAIVQK